MKRETHMARIVLTDGTGRWFEGEKAKVWDEETRWNGNNHISLATGTQWDHETLYRTAGGIHVLHQWSQWQGSSETYEEITAEAAAVWLSQNKYLDGDADEAGGEVAEAFAALEIQ
jgi:hypothetical protein